jgi:transcriptional regulator with XRE-family HTH domain
MPLVQTVIADRAKIRELAKKQDGSVAALARRLGRHPRSFTNMKRGKPVGIKFAEQIAEALGVEVDVITLPQADRPAA